ncbi:uncharacterized protein LOC119608270 isoform X1 [Lucilia sericata]|uniref:uncharacterized protein LOC119608270 isoform X1 n=2 Tax=Lucilia sericata TaxID=13632 RepID=UPI0018A8524B|nr:uncharacterized protein LOC119608270 isoform X1 [Lucilia sericata]
MATISRFVLNTTAPRLCFIKSSTKTSTRPLIGLSNTTLSNNINSIISSKHQNSIRKTLTTLQTAAANLNVGFQHTNAAQLRGYTSAPKGATTSFTGTSAATPMLLMSKYKPLQQIRNFSSLNMPLQSQCSKLVHQNAMAPLKNRRYISSKEITKNMTLYTNGTFKSEVDRNTLEFKKPTGNPLVLMMAWLMAKQKHLKKYAEIYTELGFDVMVVHITPWQLLWPVKGTQVVAAETLKFLESNKSYEPIVLHGFSVGAYQFGELMLQMSRDMDRYSHVLNRIICQVWDSAADITEIPVGVPKSIFPKNMRMQTALRNYTLYHLKTFHNQATVHYMRSSQMFHSTLCKKPALFFVSDNDLIGPPSSNQVVRENWERADIKVTWKCWKHSLHAGHLMKHREEYLDLLFKHLEECGVLEAIGVKQRAKL